MKKRNIVLKGILLFLVIGVIIGIIYQKSYAVTSEETIIDTSNKLHQKEVLVGRYKFNITGAYISPRI